KIEKSKNRKIEKSKNRKIEKSKNRKIEKSKNRKIEKSKNFIAQLNLCQVPNPQIQLFSKDFLFSLEIFRKIFFFFKIFFFKLENSEKNFLSPRKPIIRFLSPFPRSFQRQKKPGITQRKRYERYD
ncbi:MAG: hypothetical protein LBG87_06495, partial [Spirochaetaceae bacterium]|nr:hypothetical protein [Spirochaetaceae bacterium]